MTRGPARIIDVYGERLGRALQETDYLRKNLKRPEPCCCWQLKVFPNFYEDRDLDTLLHIHQTRRNRDAPKVSCAGPWGPLTTWDLSNNCPVI